MLFAFARPVDSLTVAAGASPAVSRAQLTWSAPALVDPQPTPPSDEILHRVSCASPSLCVAVDYAGNVITSSDPAGGAAAWSVRPRRRGRTRVRVVRGAVAVRRRRHGRQRAHWTDPTAGASAWTLASVNPKGRGIHGLSCPTASLCVAVDYAGNVLTSTDPTGGPGAWSAAAIDRSPTGYMGANPI